MNANRGYVIIKGSGGAGLGDRICGLAVGILYAKHCGRTLYVDWRDRAFGTHQRNLFPELFCIEGVQIADRLPEGIDVAPEIWSDRLDLSLDQLRAFDLDQRGIKWTGAAPPWDREDAIRRYSVDLSRLDHPQTAVVVWSGGSVHALVGELRTRGLVDSDHTSESMLSCTVSKHIRFQPDIEDKVRQFREQAFAGRATIGVHYRKTDEAAAARALPSESQYLRATDEGFACLPEDAIVFLATDNRDVQELYSQRYGRDRVCWFEKWMPESGASIHKNNACPDGVASAKDALVDVGLLASCDRLVLTGNSSFSALASWFSTLPASKCKSIYPDNGPLSRRMIRRVKHMIQSALAKECHP